MISKCANPECPASFHYLHEGKLYGFRREHGAAALPAGAQTEWYWLCSRCARTLALDPSGELVPVAERPAAVHTHREAA